MALYFEKHRPRLLEELDIHEELSERLLRLCETEDFPHLLFYGPSGAGKSTRIHAMLTALFGNGVNKIKAETRTFKNDRGVSFDLSILSSSYHFDVRPSDVGLRDRYIVQDLIKEIASNAPVSASSGSRSFKVVIIREADTLTREAQQALRRLMEKYMRSCRLILCCESISRIIEPLMSRCLAIRVPAPSDEDIEKVVQSVAKKERLSLPESLSTRIVEAAEGNLRRALLMLEAARISQYPFEEDQPVIRPEWEDYVDGIAALCIAEQSPKRLLEARGRLFELFQRCVPPDLIMQRLTDAFVTRMDSMLQPLVVRYAAFYEHRIHLGSKWIFHVEAFLARIMSVYKQYLLAGLEDSMFDLDEIDLQ